MWSSHQPAWLALMHSERSILSTDRQRFSKLWNEAWSLWKRTRGQMDLGMVLGVCASPMGLGLGKILKLQERMRSLPFSLHIMDIWHLDQKEPVQYHAEDFLQLEFVMQGSQVLSFPLFWLMSCKDRSVVTLNVMQNSRRNCGSWDCCSPGMWEGNALSLHETILPIYVLPTVQRGPWPACRCEALSVMGESVENSACQRIACEFLLKHQHEDGGWGESYLSSQDKVEKSYGEYANFVNIRRECCFPSTDSRRPMRYIKLMSCTSELCITTFNHPGKPILAR